MKDDKFLAIVAVTVICVGALISMGVESKDILIPAITGIFGIVTGRAMDK